jgi:hypothetical protein
VGSSSEYGEAMSPESRPEPYLCLEACVTRALELPNMVRGACTEETKRGDR